MIKINSKKIAPSFSLEDGREGLFQWDTGRNIILKEIECGELHFANGVYKNTIDVTVQEGKALIPDILLQSASPLRVFGFAGEETNGFTMIEQIFQVKERPKPSDYVFTPSEQLTLKELLDKFEDFKDGIGKEVEEYLKQNPVDIVENDPTVPQWAKEKNKPNYTAAEVGARSDTWLPTPYEIGAQPKGNYATKDEIPVIPAIPVKSVNGKIGEVELTAEDVGALGKDTDLVTQEEVQEEITNYMREHPVVVEESDPTVPAWAKQPEKPEYTPEEIGAQPKGDYALKAEIPAVPDWAKQPEPPESTNVYIGTENPPEDAEVWINPDGEVSGDDLPTASSTEKGAVIVGDGLAVDAAGRVSVKPEGAYELIETITLEEDAVIEWSQEPDGTPYKFVAIEIKAESAGKAATQNSASMWYLSKGERVAIIYYSSITNIQKRYRQEQVAIVRGYWESEFVDWNPNASAAYNNKGYYNTHLKHNKKDYPAIDGIRSSAAIPAGTYEIWGVRA